MELEVEAVDMKLPLPVEAVLVVETERRGVCVELELRVKLMPSFAVGN